MRVQELSKRGRIFAPARQPGGAERAARLRLIQVYSELAHRGEHLFASSLSGKTPTEWARYPADDAIDETAGFQWFYHSHSAEDRPQASEHGHVHLFARKPLWSRRLRSRAEQDFAKLTGSPMLRPSTRHLLGIGFDAKGVPTSLFTVNSWVTGDLMLSAPLTLELLDVMRIDTGHPQIDAVIGSVATLCRLELVYLLQCRDQALQPSASEGKLFDESLEVLSQVKIDIDAKLAAIP